MFGAEGNLADEVVRSMPKYSWAFIIAGINTMISGYLYSTEETKGAILLNVLRSFVVCTAVIIGLTMIFKGTIVWFTFGISEGIIVVIAVCLLKAANKFEFVWLNVCFAGVFLLPKKRRQRCRSAT